jgi:hypothetical protein
MQNLPRRFQFLPLILLPTLMTAAEPVRSPNPRLQESPLPFHDPQFDLIKNAHFAPAFDDAALHK